MGFVMFEFFRGWTTYEILTFILLVITSLLTLYSLCLKRLYDWYKKRKEKKEYDELMKDPFEVHFFIPTLDLHKITYEKQDAMKIYPRYELEIPKGVEDVIFLRIIPRISVKVGERYFGFKIKETKKKPKISHFKNPFVREASFQEEWYEDAHGHVHMVKERLWVKDEICVSAFKIKTYDEGDYPFYMSFHVSCNEYKSVKEERHTLVTKTLKIRVK